VAEPILYGTNNCRVKYPPERSNRVRTNPTRFLTDLRGAPVDRIKYLRKMTRSSGKARRRINNVIGQ
jgi:hypothetical protein